MNDHEHNNDSIIEVKLKYIEENVKNINKKLDEKFVTLAEFEPVRKLVYGLVALVLTSVVLAILGIVITR